MNRKRKRGRGSCGHPRCSSHRIDALQARLGADYATIDEFAERLLSAFSDFARDPGATVDEISMADRIAHTCHGCRVRFAERYLQECCTLHDLDRVEAGLEDVGSAAIFVARPAGGGVAVQLYSIAPDSSWLATDRLQ
jgi:hypothetical protein